MASSLTSDDEDVSLNYMNTHFFAQGASVTNTTPIVQIFTRLQQPADPKVLEEQQQAVNERINAIYQKAQARLAEMVSYLLKSKKSKRILIRPD